MNSQYFQDAICCMTHFIPASAGQTRRTSKVLRTAGAAHGSIFLAKLYCRPQDRIASGEMTHPARLVLNKGVRHRILAGHPWVFASEVDRVEGQAEDGGTVELRSPKGDCLGSAIYNSRSQIVARRYAMELTALDARLLGLRLHDAPGFPAAFAG